jgi:hypothetical protein
MGGRGSTKCPFLLGEQLTCDDSSRHAFFNITAGVQYFGPLFA